MSRLALAALGLCLVAAGCDAQHANPPVASVAPATAPAGRPPLTPGGELAYDVLMEADIFTNGIRGKAGDPPLAVRALYVLSREPEATAAFRRLLEDATPCGRLYALCGLWFSDPEAYPEAARVLCARSGNEKVTFRSGCEYFEGTRLASLVRYRGPGKVVHRTSRKLTRQEWREEIEARGDLFDIEGGGFPYALRFTIEVAE